MKSEQYISALSIVCFSECCYVVQDRTRDYFTDIIRFRALPNVISEHYIYKSGIHLSVRSKWAPSEHRTSTEREREREGEGRKKRVWSFGAHADRMLKWIPGFTQTSIELHDNSPIPRRRKVFIRSIIVAIPSNISGKVLYNRQCDRLLLSPSSQNRVLWKISFSSQQEKRDRLYIYRSNKSLSIHNYYAYTD